MADLKEDRKTPTKPVAPKKAPATKSSKAGTRKTGVRTKSGAVLTAEAEAVLLAEAESGYDPGDMVPRKAAGRPSLSSAGGASHRINVRVDDEIYDVLQRVASDSGRSPSELVREVLRAAYGPRS
ncbi:ribbon-helix-helix domain-containing protein [Actinoplanes sp. GCM10030250]|uniref:ribbon-helix-helix domain-containing protein n=1 Tax=Actinoplanes sp. GCM10030250 TaxID=3273376 RepID=UPI00361BBB7E